MMRVSDFDFILPKEAIAQEPAKDRQSSRLLVFNRRDSSFREGVFKDLIGYFSSGDVLVLNKTKVIPARLWAKRKTGAKIEVLLLASQEAGIWEVLLRPSARVKIAEDLFFSETEFKARILERTEKGTWFIRFSPSRIRPLLDSRGIMPTPPYIKKPIEKSSDYQTVFAKEEGSVACPTAGLHFTSSLLKRLQARGVRLVYITLHVGLGTFRPIKVEAVEDHRMDSERFSISRQASEVINKAKKDKKRIFACGTSAVRSLESSSFQDKEGLYWVKAQDNKTDLFIYPGFKFKIVDCLITNFHTPRSTNILLVSAFMGRDSMLKSYDYALSKKFRFYSFGDAMLIL
jgi:S-adenosylmethionine:tRNA ribosyltransferase-isomerase